MGDTFTTVAIVIAAIIIVRVLFVYSTWSQFKTALKVNGFKEDYTDRYHQITLDVETRRLMLKVGSAYRVYNPEDIIRWDKHWQSYTNQSGTKYRWWLELNVRDLDQPVIIVNFGDRGGECKAWFGRLNAAFNS